MREIKFRAWNKAINYMDDRVRVTTLENEIVVEVLDGFTKWSELDDFVLMQYTGLKDNSDCLLDVNEEKEIYEGDIMTVSNDKITVTGIIKYELGMFIIVSDDLSDGWKPLYDFVEIGGDYQWVNGVVIGNIYQNPEMISKQN